MCGCRRNVNQRNVDVGKKISTVVQHMNDRVVVTYLYNKKMKKMTTLSLTAPRFEFDIM